MTTFLLIPGAGGSGWYWHLVQAGLERAGHTALAVDLPAADPAAGLEAYRDAALRRLGSSAPDGDLVVAGQSLGGFVAPLVAERVASRLLVLVAAMIPQPGERAGEWWQAVGQQEAAAAYARAEGRDPGAPFDPVELFLHDVPPDVAAQSAEHVGDQSDRPFADPWPLSTWPEVPTAVVAGRLDRLFPLPMMQRQSRHRLGIEPEVIDAGHLVALAQPAALSQILLAKLAATTR